jgi:membrane protein implicated in regulation of membrane protease activity
MNFEDLASTWSRQLVVGQRISADLVQRALVQEVRQRSRRVRRIIGVAAFVFVVGWGTALVTHYTGIKPFTPLNLAYLVAVTVVDAVFFYYAFRSLQQNRDEQGRMGSSLIAAVRGSLGAVERQMRDCRRLGYGAVVALGGSMSFMAWKYFAGEFPLRGLVTGTVLDFALAIGLALTLRRYYQRELRPRRDELLRQIEDLDTER